MTGSFRSSVAWGLGVTTWVITGQMGVGLQGHVCRENSMVTLYPVNLHLLACAHTLPGINIWMRKLAFLVPIRNVTRRPWHWEWAKSQEVVSLGKCWNKAKVKSCRINLVTPTHFTFWSFRPCAWIASPSLWLQKGNTRKKNPPKGGTLAYVY